MCGIKLAQSEASNVGTSVFMEASHSAESE